MIETGGAAMGAALETPAAAPDATAQVPAVVRRLIDDGHAVFVDERSLDFVRLTDTLQPQKADPRIGLIATDVPPEAWPLVSGMMDTLGAGRVKLPV